MIHSKNEKISKKSRRIYNLIKELQKETKSLRKGSKKRRLQKRKQLDKDLLYLEKKGRIRSGCGILGDGANMMECGLFWGGAVAAVDFTAGWVSWALSQDNKEKIVKKVTKLVSEIKGKSQQIEDDKISGLTEKQDDIFDFSSAPSWSRSLQRGAMVASGIVGTSALAAATGN